MGRDYEQNRRSGTSSPEAVKAMGGNLSLVAEFPDRAPVVLSGIAEER